MTGKELLCSREFRFWCSATTLYCYMTPCQPLTAQTDDLYPIVHYLYFLNSLGNISAEGKNNNNYNYNKDELANRPSTHIFYQVAVGTGITGPLSVFRKSTDG